MWRTLWLRGVTALAVLVPGLPCARGTGPLAAQVVRVSNVAPFYSPGGLTVEVGDTVEWRNGELSDVHVIFLREGQVVSPPIEAGAAWRHAFAAEGEYAYRCRLHPWMRGVVTVVPHTVQAREYELPPGWAPAIDVVPDGLGGAWVVEGAPVAGEGAATGRVARLGPDGRVEEGHIDSPKFRVRYLGADARTLWFLEPVSGVPIGWRRAGGGGTRRWTEPRLVRAPAVLGGEGTVWFPGETPGTLRSLRLADGSFRDWPLGGAAGTPTALGAAADGAVWAALAPGDRLVRLDPATGAVADFPLPRGSRVSEVSPRPGNEAWFLDGAAGRVGRVRDGWSVGFLVRRGTEARGLWAGPEPDLAWFAELGSDRVGTVGPAGVASLAVPPALAPVVRVRTDAGGTLWILGAGGRRVGKADPGHDHPDTQGGRQW